jgi:alpha-beta hydrolase superfamily lysophospholipase
MRERDVTVPSAFDLAGVLCLPEDASGVPAIALLGGAGTDAALLGGAGADAALLGGAGADTRDGDLEPGWPPGTTGLPAPGTLRRIAHRLAAAGVASLRWDRRGRGASGGQAEGSGHGTDLEDALAAVAWLRARAEVNPARVAVAGHSAGVLIACQVCRDDHDVAGAALLGGPASPFEDILRWNMGRASRHWEHFTTEQRAWLEANRAVELAHSEGTDRFIAAVRAGEPTVTFERKGTTAELPTARFRQALGTDWAAEFRHVHCPALVLHGGEDLVVPVTDALAAYRVVHGAGNDDVELAILPGLDHYFSAVPADPGRRLWNRVSLEGLRLPMAPEALAAIERWAVRVLRPA